jgi:hypothetical protein
LVGEEGSGTLLLEIENHFQDCIEVIMRPVCVRFAFVFFLFALTVFSTLVFADTNPISLTTKAPASAHEESKKESSPIQDNSFLIEEAYNQEFGVVQHISTFMRDFNTHSWVYTFTQEWPVPGQKHQFSYTASAVHNADFAPNGPGFGDLALNYRYQLAGSGDTRLAVAPRVSLLAPTGDFRAGRGSGGYGVQINIPASVVVTKQLVTHWNVGTTLVPNASNANRERAMTTGYNLGQSFIWLAHPRFNVMFETVYAGTESVVGPGRTQRAHDLLLNPGIRWAHNFKNGLQIVPGIGVPIGVGPSAGDKGIFAYLSFEHPFRGLKK